MTYHSSCIRIIVGFRAMYVEDQVSVSIILELFEVMGMTESISTV
jgi:hypothetical protein